jgi:hypothetical protein
MESDMARILLNLLIAWPLLLPAGTCACDWTRSKAAVRVEAGESSLSLLPPSDGSR